MIKRWVRRLFLVLAVSLLYLLTLTPMPDAQDEQTQLDRIVGKSTFGYVDWWWGAVQVKGTAVLANHHSYLTPEAQKQLVLDYVALMAEIATLNREIDNLFIDPDITDPKEASAPLNQELEAKRANLAEMQPLAEAILQDQVATILTEEGFAVMEQTWPPVMMHMSALPSRLVISPRDKIERAHGISLDVSLTVIEHEALESEIFEQMDMSALVVPIGGLSLYPAMIMETGNLNWLIEVTAHEWSHHWLGFHPLGLNITDPEVRSINETTAGIFDVAVAELVLRRYYPEFILTDGGMVLQTAVAQQDNTPPPFDFRAEMEQTRIRADELLADGQIVEAEAYMESQRQRFWENGYRIRKLNQAYFAFYGNYAATQGASGSSPIGPLVRQVWENSPSLRAFMDTMAPINSLTELQMVAQTQFE